MSRNYQRFQEIIEEARQRVMKLLERSNYRFHSTGEDSIGHPGEFISSFEIRDRATHGGRQIFKSNQTISADDIGSDKHAQIYVELYNAGYDWLEKNAVIKNI